MKVFVVDDSMLIWLKIIEEISSIESIEVVGVSALPEEAYARIIRLKPELVILDINLIGGNGIELLQKIKNEMPGIIVIMFTNYPYKQYKDKCYELGADYFFDKSMEFNKVFDILMEKSCA